MGDLYAPHLFPCESARGHERLESIAGRDEENRNWAYAGCFHNTSVLAILDFTRCGGGSKKALSSFCLHVRVVDMHLTEESVDDWIRRVEAFGYFEGMRKTKV